MGLIHQWRKSHKTFDFCVIFVAKINLICCRIYRIAALEARWRPSEFLTQGAQMVMFLVRDKSDFGFVEMI